MKVLDFGVVKLPASVTGVDAALTHADMVPGTPAFMAPEVIAGDAPIDGRADLYALGCVAYWLVTGKLVFGNRPAAATLVAHMHDEPQPISARTEQPVPNALDALVIQCLAKRPEDRPASAGALARALDAIAVPQPWSLERAADWWEQHASARGGGDPARAGLARPAIAERER